MRINPNRPENVRQAQALKEARQVMHSVDEVLELVKGADDGPQDLWSGQGDVLTTQLLQDEGAEFSPRRWVNDASLKTTAEGSELKASAQYPGSWGLLPLALDAKVSRRESADGLEYRFQWDDGSLRGPSTTEVSVDKKTGEVELRKYAFGFLRVPYQVQD